MALTSLAAALLWPGDFAAAAALIAEAETLTEATGSQLPPYSALALAAWQGREAEARGLIETNVDSVMRRGEGMGLANMQWATAALYNGLGRYEDALAAAQQAAEHPQELWSTSVLPELIEAAARSGKTASAADALQRLSETALASGTEWALGTEACSRALFTHGETAESLYREAIEPGRPQPPRVSSPAPTSCMANGCADRAVGSTRASSCAVPTICSRNSACAGSPSVHGSSSMATGERVRKRTTETPARLTARETQIARLAGDGLSNPEIAARLFMSPRTVEYHLHKVFTKLAISSRNQLHGVLTSHRKNDRANL